MITKIILPQLGESIHEGTIGKWLKNVGDTVEEYEPLVEIITDKVNAEVPAPVRGTLSAIMVAEGQTVEVGTVIGEMLEVGAAATPEAAIASPVVSKKVETTTVYPGQASLAKPASEPSIEAVEASFPNGTAAGGWYEDEDEDTFAGASLPSAPTQPAPAQLAGIPNGRGAAKEPGGKPNRYSPAVRRLAEEHQLKLDQLGLRGTGLGGRVTRDDVQMFLENQRQLHQPVPTRALPATPVEAVENIAQALPAMHDQIAANALREVPAPASNPPKVTLPATAPAPLLQAKATQAELPKTATAPVFSEAAVTASLVAGAEELVPLTPMRKAIAEHMVRSVQTSPHAWTMVEVDVTRLVRHRAAVKEEFKRREGVDLTYLPFVVKAVIDGLRQFPQMNASWVPDGSGIILKRELNIGVAVDVPDGLVVPVLHRADEKSLVGLARSLNEVVNRARSRKLSLADIQGGTFTVNNPGWFGSVMSQPILNQPQAGIVTMEAIVKRPVVVTDTEGNDTVVVRSMMNMCLSFDHRVVDGAIAGRFLQYVKKWLESRDYSASF